MNDSITVHVIQKDVQAAEKFQLFELQKRERTAHFEPAWVSGIAGSASLEYSTCFFRIEYYDNRYMSKLPLEGSRHVGKSAKPDDLSSLRQLS
jgi:hypothetical protein